MKKKMYKSKKQWVVAGISGIALITATSIGQSVLAEDIKGDTQITPTLVNQPTHLGEETSQADLTPIKSTSNSTEFVTNKPLTSEPSINTETIGTKSEKNESQLRSEPIVKEKASLNFQPTALKQVVTNPASVEVTPTVTYASHISKVGWQKNVGENEVSGLVGLPNQLEAIKIDLQIPANQTGDINYSSLVKGQGWQTAVVNGQISGTVGKSTPIEAISIRLTGELSVNNDIYYRVYVKNMGWLKWASNGQNAGTSLLNTPLEAYEVMILKKGQFQDSLFNAASYPKPLLNYQVFIEKTGWQNYVTEGGTSGTVGKSKQIEAVKVNLSSTEYGNIVYKTHVQNKGWLSPVTTDQISGLVGESKQVEAIQIALTGQLANRYDIVYRAHVQNIGWQAWVKNNQIAGTTGISKQIEALEIKLIEKANVILSNAKSSFIEFVKPKMTYKTYVEKMGWQNPVTDGLTSGTTGQSKQVEGLLVTLDNKSFGDITYKVHLQNIGWMTNVISNQIAGLPGQGKQIEAIQLGLTGILAERYDIYYRAHVQNVGWQSWTRNNLTAGTVGQSKQIEALQIKLVEKPLQNVALLINQSAKKGTADVLFTKGLNSKDIKQVKLAVWSLADKSNIFYYTAPTLVNGETLIHINENNHKYLSGKYNVLAYTYYQDGSHEEINVGTTYFNAPTTTVYYNQKAFPWGSKVYGNYYFGPTGCVPTSLAMIFSSLTGTSILPSQVGDYLYNKTNEFNKGGNYGTTSKGLQSAVKAFGFQATNLSTQAMLVSALQAGHHVAFAIQNNIFVRSGSHEMVLKGNNNGNAYVYDPYTKELCGWYSVNTLWNQKSTDPDDNMNIAAPFFMITTI